MYGRENTVNCASSVFITLQFVKFQRCVLIVVVGYFLALVTTITCRK